MSNPKALPARAALPLAPVPLREAAGGAPQPVYDQQQRLVGWLAGERFVAVPPAAPELPPPPTPEAIDHLLDQGRTALHGLQLARADGQVAIDIDYADQIAGNARASWSKFQQNLAHNRARADVLATVREELQQILTVSTATMTTAFATYAAEQQAVLDERLQRRQLAMQAAAWQVEEAHGPEAQAHHRALELAAQAQAHEVTLSVLAAGQQLPDLLAQLQQQYAANPSVMASAVMGALQAAMTQFQQIAAETDPAARKQLAEQFRPLLTTVLQQAIALAKAGAAPGGAS